MKKIIILLAFILAGVMVKGQGILHIDTLQTNPIVARTFEFPSDGEYYMTEKDGYTVRYKVTYYVKLDAGQLFKIHMKHEMWTFRDTVGSPYRATKQYMIGDTLRGMVVDDLIYKLQNE